MALNISGVFQTLFDSEVKQSYQAESVLRPYVRVKPNVKGSTQKFYVIGKGTASVRTPQSDVVPIGVTYTPQTATMSDYSAAEYSDIFQAGKVNFEERQELVQLCGKAIGRRLDQLIIAALDAASSTQSVAAAIGGSATNMNVAKIREAKLLLDKKNVPQEDRTLVIHADGLANLLSETSVTSSDFVNVKALVNGQVDTFLGFKVVSLGDRDEGGLTKTGNDRQCFAFHKASIGLAENMSARTEIHYIPEKTSHLVNAMFSAGSTHIDAEGIVEITTTE
jgi:hypothetical protein